MRHALCAMAVFLPTVATAGVGTSVNVMSVAALVPDSEFVGGSAYASAESSIVAVPGSYPSDPDLSRAQQYLQGLRYPSLDWRAGTTVVQLAAVDTALSLTRDELYLGCTVFSEVDRLQFSERWSMLVAMGGTLELVMADHATSYAVGPMVPLGLQTALGEGSLAFYATGGFKAHLGNAPVRADVRVYTSLCL